MPADVFFKVANSIHRTLFSLSGGRIGGSVDGMPALKLVTTGRRSGEPRTVMLSTPHVDGDAIAIVASKGGDDHAPAWFLNLRDDPAVTVELAGGEPRPMVARIAAGDERAALWDAITAAHPRYAQYQDKTEREIPVVVLEPAG
jgi:deazaflavin-dependent oxidoreductase (nitroreductase family)